MNTNVTFFVEISAIIIFGLLLRRYVSHQKITVRQIAFVGIMAAAGTALSFVTFIPIGPGINVDLSHIGTFVVALGLGPFYGMITGALIGIYPMVGFSNPLLPVGKALTGLVVGFLFSKARLIIGIETVKERLLKIVPTIIVGWIPEAAMIWFTLAVWGIPYALPVPVVKGILVKGIGEIIFLGFVCEALFASKALKQRLESLR